MQQVGSLFTGCVAFVKVFRLALAFIAAKHEVLLTSVVVKHSCLLGKHLLFLNEGGTLVTTC